MPSGPTSTEKWEMIGGILRKIKSEIEKSLPTSRKASPIPISRHERRSREWLEIGIGLALSEEVEIFQSLI